MSVALEERPATYVPEHLVKADDVADVLALRPSTVRDLSTRKTNPMPSIKIAGSRRWRLSDVLAWVDSGAS
jgi:predicted DNA-binding transcriptional regulator AlpA